MAEKYIIKSNDIVKKIIEKIKRASTFVDKYKELGKNPGLPSNAFLNMASSMYSMGRLQEAEDLLRSAVCFPSNSPNALLNLGVIKQSTGDYQQAIKFYHAAYKKDKSNAKSLVLWGNCLAIMGKTEEAIKKYGNAVKINSTEAEAYLSWGALLIKLKQYNEAKEKLELASRYNIKDIRSMYMLGIIEIELGNYDSALSYLKHVVNCTENNYEALHNIAYVYFKQNRYDDAISYAKKSLAIYQHKIETYLLLGDIYAMQDKEKESLNFYSMAEMNDLKTFYLYLSWATSLQKFGYYSEAIEKLEQAKILTKRENAEVYSRLALSYTKINKNDIALENINKALELSPDSYLANLLYAEIEVENRNYQHAIELLKKCEKGYEIKGRNYMLQAICYFEMNNYDKSQKSFEKALDYSGNSEDIILEYMKFLIKKENYELANAKFKDIAKTSKNEEILNNYFFITYNLAKQNSYKYNITKAIEIAEKIENLGYNQKYAKEKAELEGLLRDYD